MRFLLYSLPCSIYMDSSPQWSISPCLFATPTQFRDPYNVLRPTTVSEHRMQISDTWLYSSHVTIALIYQVQLQLLAVVHLTRVLDASSRLERPALAPSVIDNDLHMVNCYVTLLYRSAIPKADEQSTIATIEMIIISKH